MELDRPDQREERAESARWYSVYEDGFPLFCSLLSTTLTGDRLGWYHRVDAHTTTDNLT